MLQTIKFSALRPARWTPRMAHTATEPTPVGKAGRGAVNHAAHFSRAMLLKASDIHPQSRFILYQHVSLNESKSEQ